MTYHSYLPENISSDLKDHTFPVQELSTVSKSGDASELDSIDEKDLNKNEVNDLFDNVVKCVLQQD